MGNLHDSIDHTDLVDGLDLGGEASMDAKDLAFDYCGKGEKVEDVGDVSPDIAISVLSLAFIKESIELGCLTGFVISSKQGDS